MCPRWAALSLLLATAPLQAQPFSGSGKTPSFSAGQVERGKAGYVARGCGAMCHGDTLNGGGGPALRGEAFGNKWRDFSPDALFTYIQERMPPGAGGTLSDETATDIAALIFATNGFAPGKRAFRPSKETFELARPALPTIKQDAHSSAALARRAALLESIRPVTDDMLRQPAESDWLTWRGSYAGLGYSSLRGINRDNAHRLTLSWARSVPSSANEFEPLVHDGVLFIKSGNRVQALDGTNGELLWEYARAYPAWMGEGQVEIVKNIAIYRDLLYVPFLDGHLLALNAKTGKVVWDHQLVGAAEDARRVPGGIASSDPQHSRMVADGGPLVANGTVVIGIAGCANAYKGGCFIVGVNADSGEEKWRFHTIARPGEPGGDSWNGAAWDKRFGASVWYSGTYDPQLNLVYFGISNTYNIDTLIKPQARKGESKDALYTNSTVALDPATGKLAWHYQHFSGDVWDLDWAYERMLLTLPVGGATTNVAATVGKIGIVDVLDRKSGQYKFSVDLGLQNIVTGIDPATGKKEIDPRFLPAQDLTFKSSPCPFARNVPSTAYDPTSYILYVPIIDASCATNRAFDGHYGQVMALDLAKQKVLWTQSHRTPEASSLLVTAGGLVFESTADRIFRASDAGTGKVLWQTRLDNMAKSNPISYSINGKQYVAIMAGGMLAQNLFNRLPEGDDITTNAQTLWVMSLPDEDR
jgi:alcohol dehydrogenase (cytochrome c)